MTQESGSTDVREEEKKGKQKATHRESQVGILAMSICNQERAKIVTPTPIVNPSIDRSTRSDPIRSDPSITKSRA
jgi:hypothetical protein